MTLLTSLFDSTGFPARWECGTWSPTLGWLHIGSDLLIWSAYTAIPLVLSYFVYRKKFLPFRPVLVLFTVFILACGMTHLMDALIFYWPGYRLAGVLKLVTAVASWVTVVALVRVAPRMMSMRTPEELEREVEARRAVEANLERLVRERTDALAAEREQFRVTLASIGDAVIATDVAGRVTFLNPVAERLIGCSRDQAVGRPMDNVFRVVDEATHQPMENPAIMALRTGANSAVNTPMVLVAPDGRERPIADSVAPIRDRAGRVTGSVLVFRDVTEQRALEQTRQTQTRLTGMRADIASALASRQPKNEALQSCCETFVRYLGVALARIWVLPAGGDTLELRASAGLYTHLDGMHGRIKLGECKIGRMALSQQPHVTNRLKGDREVTNPLWVEKAGLTAFAGYPLLVEGRTVGVLALFSRTEMTPAVLLDIARMADALAQYIDRRRTERELAESEARYRQLFDANPLPMWVYDRVTLEFLAVNDAAVYKYGYTRDEFAALTLKDIRPPEDIPALLEKMARPEDGIDDAGVWRHRLKDGRVILVEIVSHALTFWGRPAEIVLAHDVTEQIRSEDALRASERLLRQVIDAVPNFIFVKDRAGRFVFANRAFAAAHGTTTEAIVGMGDADFHHDPAECANFRRADERVFATGEDHFTPQEPFTTARGEKRYLRTTKRLLPATDRLPEAVLGVAVDITSEKLATDALESSYRLYRLLADHAQDVVTLAGADGKLTYVSPSCERTTGQPSSEVLGKPIWHLGHPDDRRAVEHHWGRAAAGQVATTEWRWLASEGREVWMETVFTPVQTELGEVTRVVACGRDITGRKKLEEQFRQAQKLEAVGYLAGGVAHDFNNLLTVVNGCSELVLETLDGDQPHRALVEAIHDAGQRGTTLTRQLLAFSRQQMLRVERFDPNRVVEEAAKLLARLLGEDIAFATALDPRVGTVKADIGQFEQVLVNLSVNSRDAMPRGGRLTIATSPVEFATADTLPTPDARPGRYVRLTVADTGAGMPPEVQGRVFEPFFSTKPVGQGTGLGLATVYGIVRQCGGFVTLNSVPGEGTEFAIHLPRADTTAHDPPDPAPAPATPPRGRERVLVVEDNETVRLVTQTILERQGYRVAVAADGEQAVELCGGPEGPPDLVVTDVVMPGLGDRELAELLWQLHPALKVLFVSGYTADRVLRHGIEEERVAFLQKPYSAETLARAVRDTLDAE